MAVIAVVAAGDVCRMFSGRSHTIVATAAAALHLGMVDSNDRPPDRRTVAVFADSRRQDMCGRFAGSVNAVVAAHAVGNDVDMIERCRDPCGGRMAVIADIAAGDMRRVLAGGSHTVMTGAAGP